VTSLLPKTEHQIDAVAATNLKRAQEFGEKFGTKHAFEGYEKLANCADVDVVYVNNLHPQHLPCVKLALNAGKAVLCEKALAINAREVQEMIDLARQKGVFFMEGFWNRCFPIYDEIRKVLKDGRIGEPKILQGIMAFQPDKEELARLFKKELGGSAILDTGCYLVQAVTLFFNGQRPESVHATGKVNEEGVDILETVTLTYKNNSYAQLVVSFVGPTANRLVVYGTKGHLEFPFVNRPTSLTINSETIEHPLPEAKTDFYYGFSQGMIYEAQHVRDCLLKGLKESPLVPLEHSHVIASIMDEIRRQLGVVFPQDNQ